MSRKHERPGMSPLTAGFLTGGIISTLAIGGLVTADLASEDSAIRGVTVTQGVCGECGAAKGGESKETDDGVKTDYAAEARYGIQIGDTRYQMESTLETGLGPFDETEENGGRVIYLQDGLADESGRIDFYGTYGTEGEASQAIGNLKDGDAVVLHGADGNTLAYKVYEVNHVTNTEEAESVLPELLERSKAHSDVIVLSNGGGDIEAGIVFVVAKLAS